MTRMTICTYAPLEAPELNGDLPAPISSSKRRYSEKEATLYSRLTMKTSRYCVTKRHP